MSELELKNILYFGYRPRWMIPSWIDGGLPESVQGRDRKMAHKVFDRIFDDACGSAHGLQGVPLSGGLDSRLILAELVERLGGDQVVTFTFGVPGQLDFEIARSVAKYFKTKHVGIDLRAVEVNWEKVQEANRGINTSYVLDRFYSTLVFNEAKRVGVTGLWSGFLGDPLVGGHYSSGSTEKSNEVISRFLASQNRSSVIKSASALPPASFEREIKNSVRGYFNKREYLDFGVRQRDCIAAIVLPDGSWNSWSVSSFSHRWGYQTYAPFCDAQWAAHWLSLPREAHINQSEYRLFCHERNPLAFQIPTKEEYGESGTRSRRRLAAVAKHTLKRSLELYLPMLNVRSDAKENYLNFGAAFRKRADYLRMLERSIDIIGDVDKALAKRYEALLRLHRRSLLDRRLDLHALLSAATFLDSSHE